MNKIVKAFVSILFDHSSYALDWKWYFTKKEESDIRTLGKVNVDNDHNFARLKYVTNGKGEN